MKCVLALLGLATAQLMLSPQFAQLNSQYNNQFNAAQMSLNPTLVLLMDLSGSCPSALSMIKSGEGFRSCMYKDTKGIPTICYGYNLRNGDARSAITREGANFDDVLSGKKCLSESQCTDLLQKEVNVATSGKNSIFGNLGCACADAVAIDMTYNMGAGSMRSFNTFNNLMKTHQWVAAANDLAGTAYCRDVGSRCSRNQGYIKKC